VAVGGVTLENMPAFFKAGARGVAVATGLADTKLVAAGEYTEITRISKKWMEVARGSRPS
jgi:2-keto-3-deoxy-6-phosphogluconate aldolase